MTDPQRPREIASRIVRFDGAIAVRLDKNPARYPQVLARPGIAGYAVRSDLLIKAERYKAAPGDAGRRATAGRRRAGDRRSARHQSAHLPRRVQLGTGPRSRDSKSQSRAANGGPGLCGRDRGRRASCDDLPGRIDSARVYRVVLSEASGWPPVRQSVSTRRRCRLRPYGRTGQRPSSGSVAD